MPRPGPRPYECVRRAWHSDRHQPIRGSLIQEIFRIVNEIHSSATKKNKEWQEKLPIVVLKAEEIMYSKANSEAEYVNVNTLWDRANDAINTIIRRDESTETGDLLQPCIEAALHLGCTPRRSSRSQRNNHPRCYLNPEKPLASFPLSNFDTRKVLELPFSPSTSFSNVNHQYVPPRQAHSLSSSCSVYPLYYGDKFALEDSSSFKASSKPNNSLMKDDDKIGVMEKQSSSSSVVMISQDISETPPINECDLSLRLGPLKVGSMSSGLLPSKNDHQDMYFLPKDNAHDMLDCSSSTKWKYKTQNLNAEAPLRKRKADVCNHPSDDRQFCLPLKLQLKQFNGRISNAYQ